MAKKKRKKFVVTGYKKGRPFQRVVSTTLGATALVGALRIRKAFTDVTISNIRKLK
ncbi:unnamed protein product [marine sediment metagenome]|uniref:Uncharacterized protein n=1 Tax=marine sediment metagenome TaxID=412755 RepID=X0T0B6_9ZZZZ